MLVNGFKIKKIGKFTKFTANFYISNCSSPFIAFIRLPNLFAKVEFPFDAFYVMAFPISLALGEELIFDGNVSDQLYRSLFKINKYLKLNNSLNIEAKITGRFERKKKKKYDLAQFFTSGLDSLFTLIKNQEENSNRIKYLLSVDGFDINLNRKLLLKKTHKNITDVAKIFKKKVIFISCNIRDLSDKVIDWEKYHGAAIAGCGLCTFEKIGGVYISSSDAYLYKRKVSWGTGNKLDTMWSTEDKWFKAYGGNLDRFSKAKELVKSKYSNIVYKYIRVCWENSVLGKNDLNCCSCEKCLRTYLVLIGAGSPIKIEAFNNLNYQSFRTITLPYHHIAETETWRKSYMSAIKRNDLGNLNQFLHEPFKKDVVLKKIKIYKFLNCFRPTHLFHSISYIFIKFFRKVRALQDSL